MPTCPWRIVGLHLSPESLRRRSSADLQPEIFHRGFDVETAPEGPTLHAPANTSNPCSSGVVLAGGRSLPHATRVRCRSGSGRSRRSPSGSSDLVSWGRGPAGLALGLGASEGFHLRGGGRVGGQEGTSSRIRKLPGFPTGIRGRGNSQAGHCAGDQGSVPSSPVRAWDQPALRRGGTWRVRLSASGTRGGPDTSSWPRARTTGGWASRMLSQSRERLSIYAATRDRGRPVQTIRVVVVGAGNPPPGAMFLSREIQGGRPRRPGGGLGKNMIQLSYITTRIASAHNIEVL